LVFYVITGANPVSQSIWSVHDCGVPPITVLLERSTCHAWVFVECCWVFKPVVTVVTVVTVVAALFAYCRHRPGQIQLGFMPVRPPTAPSAPLADRMGRLIRIKAKPNL